MNYYEDLFFRFDLIHFNLKYTVWHLNKKMWVSKSVFVSLFRKNYSVRHSWWKLLEISLFTFYLRWDQLFQNIFELFRMAFTSPLITGTFVHKQHNNIVINIYFHFQISICFHQLFLTLRLRHFHLIF